MKKKEILIITNYFPPEKGAASNRIFAMAKGFHKRNYKVTVVCPLPNYPDGKVFKNFKNSFFKKSKEKFSLVYRLWIWPTKSSNKFIRLFSMISFSISLILFLILKKIPKKVIIQYSPVFVGFTAVFWSKLFSKKIILNISDLWPLAGLEIGILKKGFYYNVLSRMEKFCYWNSKLILGQSDEIVDHVKSFKTNKPLLLYRNLPDFKPQNTHNKIGENETIKIVYAGLLGVAQGMYHICKEVSFPDKVQLHVYGSGPEEELIKKLNKPNVFFHGSISRDKLHIILQNYDIGFVPLINRIYGSVPSKIFELIRLGLPILYFAGGEGEIIVTKNKLGWVVPVSNLKQLQEFINSMSKEKLTNFSKSEIQKTSNERFSFDKQFESLIEKIEVF